MLIEPMSGDFFTQITQFKAIIIKKLFDPNIYFFAKIFIQGCAPKVRSYYQTHMLNYKIDLFCLPSYTQTNEQTQTNLHKKFSSKFVSGDYTDFYSSIDHATNVGTMFRSVPVTLN